jgi:hypothetical protein
MEWRTIPSSPSYEASSTGLIRRKDTGYLKSKDYARGYVAVALYEDGQYRRAYVHRLVCEAFYGAPKAGDIHAAHLNGVRDDNRAENLAWATRSENERHKRAHGTSNDGQRNGMAKLPAERIAEIRASILALPRSSGGRRIRKGALAPLAAQYGVTASCLRQLLSGSRWRES